MTWYDVIPVKCWLACLGVISSFCRSWFVYRLASVCSCEAVADHWAADRERRKFRRGENVANVHSAYCLCRSNYDHPHYQCGPTPAATEATQHVEGLWCRCAGGRRRDVNDDRSRACPRPAHTKPVYTVTSLAAPCDNYTSVARAILVSVSRSHFLFSCSYRFPMYQPIIKCL